MDPTALVLLAGMILLIAALYASVGHAGASGYLAAMALIGVAPLMMKPTALSLNILVATIAAVKYYRRGYFSWQTFWPFAVCSIPAAFVGGMITLPEAVYKPIVGVVLAYAAVRLFGLRRVDSKDGTNPAPRWMALIAGTVLGLLSGLTGVGGGIFLSPVLLLTGWADTRTTSGVAALFILCNSIAGLGGYLAQTPVFPPLFPYLAPVALIGGWIGAEFGSKLLPAAAIRRILSVVLLLAGVKMAISAFF